MRETMTPEEMDGWMAYATIEPFWFEKLPHQLALIAAFFAAAHGAKVEPKDFLVPTDRNEVEETPDGFASPDQAASIVLGVVGNVGNR